MEKYGAILSAAASRRENLSRIAIFGWKASAMAKKGTIFHKKGKALQTDWLFSLHLSYPELNF